MLHLTPDGIYCDYCLAAAGFDPDQYPPAEGQDCGIDIGYGGDPNIACDCESCQLFEGAEEPDIACSCESCQLM